MALRPYQVDAIARVQQCYRDGARAVLLQLPTGGGKTHAAASGVIAPSVARGRRVIFLADLEEIILDTTERLCRDGLHAASILNGRAMDPTAPVQVASQQTLVSWQRRGLELPPADRVILDECHGAPASTVRALLGHLRDCGALLLGLTATPARGDGLPLDEFDRIVCGPQPRELVAAGALVPCEVLSPGGMLDRGVAMDPVDAVLTLGAGRRAVVFAPHGAEARRIAADLTARGEPAVAVLDSMARDERRAVRARLARSEVRHLVTVRALQKGFDAPVLDCCVLTSECTVTSYLQSIGRVLRPSPETGKRDALVIDLRGAVYHHGLPLDDRAWSLAGGQGVALGASSGGDAGPDLRRCKACHAIFPPRTVCPRCGSVLVSDPRPLRVQRAEMFAQSTVPVATRAQRYIDGTVRAMVSRGMRAEKAAVVARAKAPAWVREALEAGSRGVSHVA
jgi:DNA repair protein RadD